MIQHRLISLTFYKSLTLKRYLYTFHDKVISSVMFFHSLRMYLRLLLSLEGYLAHRNKMTCNLMQLVVMQLFIFFFFFRENIAQGQKLSSPNYYFLFTISRNSNNGLKLLNSPTTEQDLKYSKTDVRRNSAWVSNFFIVFLDLISTLDYHTIYFRKCSCAIEC